MPGKEGGGWGFSNKPKSLTGKSPKEMQTVKEMQTAAKHMLERVIEASGLGIQKEAKDALLAAASASAVERKNSKKKKLSLSKNSLKKGQPKEWAGVLYCFGKTKVFFAEGLLEACEDYRLLFATVCCTRIQSLGRGHLKRKFINGPTGPRGMFRMVRKLQTVVGRGAVKRRRFLRLKRGLVNLQAVERGRVARRQVAVMREERAKEIREKEAKAMEEAKAAKAAAMASMNRRKSLEVADAAAAAAAEAAGLKREEEERRLSFMAKREARRRESQEKKRAEEAQKAKQQRDEKETIATKLRSQGAMVHEVRACTAVAVVVYALMHSCSRSIRFACTAVAVVYALPSSPQSRERAQAEHKQHKQHLTPPPAAAAVLLFRLRLICPMIRAGWASGFGAQRFTSWLPTAKRRCWASSTDLQYWQSTDKRWGTVGTCAS
jgi:hypothetical protein